MRQLQKFWVLGILALLVAACSTSDEKPASNFAYFPLKKGNTWTYAVDEVMYDTLIQNKKLSYQEQHKIIDSYKNQLGEMVYIIHLSTRKDATAPWGYSKTWSAKISYLNEVIVQEENISYLKILIPVASGLSWMGNKYNDIESTRNNGRIDKFVVSDFKKPFKDFSKTFKVEESSDDNFSYKDIRYSIYAENTGLVYRVNQYVEYCDENDCFGLGLRKHEVTKIQMLVEYGVE